MILAAVAIAAAIGLGVWAVLVALGDYAEADYASALGA
jgi:hypothetical protein